jgi:hypothetical protein
MAEKMTNRGLHLLATGGIVPGTTDLRMGLLTTFAGVTNVPDINFIADMESHADFAELTTGAVSNYARVALTTEASTEVDASDWDLTDADDVAFGNLVTGGTIVGWFIFIQTGSDATAAVVDMGSLTSTPTNGGAFTVTTPSGLWKLTSS